MSYDNNLPPGVTQAMIDRYYGCDQEDLEFDVVNVNVYEEEIEVEVEWTENGDNWIHRGGEPWELVSEYYCKETVFWLPLECKDMSESDLKNYIETYKNPY